MKRKMFTGVLLFMMLCICSMINVSQASAAISDEKDVELAIVSEMRNFEEEIDISEYKVKSEEITSIMSNIFNEYPELFYVKDVYNYYYGSNDIVVSVKVQYTNSNNEIKRMKSELENEVDKALSRVTSDMTDLQKVLVIHDYLALNTEYDYENFQDSSIPYSSYTTYGTMVSKKAVCLGYAKAFMYIMQKLELECHIVASSEMNHAWNVVKVDGSYYNVDVTKDDVVYDTLGYVSHKRFLLSNKKIEQENYIIENTKYTVSNEKYDDYFWRDVNSTILHNNGKWYYTSNSKIYNYNFKTQESNLFYEIGDEKWYVKDSSNYYAASYTRVALFNDNIIFNTPSAIYAINEHGKCVKIFEANTAKGNIYGLAFVNNVLCYQLKNIASEQGVKYQTNIKTNSTLIAIAETVENNGGLTPGENLSADAVKKTVEEVKPSKEAEKKATVVKKDVTTKNVEKNTIDDKKSKQNYTSLKNKDIRNKETKQIISAPLVEKVKDNEKCETVKAFTLNTESLNIKAGDMAQLFVGKVYITDDDADINISWSSSDDSVVQIDKNGRIQALAEGEAIIKCTINSIVKICVINVKNSTIKNICKIFFIDYENHWRRISWFIKKIPKKMVKESCFVKRAMNTGKGYKAERLCKRALKQTAILSK